MKLFDEIERTDTQPSSHSERSFDYLNRTARASFTKIRDVLEVWFDRYPDEHKTELRAQFRKGALLEAPFLELLLHEMLLRLGYVVRVHPDNPTGKSTRPDFEIVSPASASRAYVEATVATDQSEEDSAAEARVNQVYDTLNRMSSRDFFIGVRLHGYPSTPPPGRKMRAFVKEKFSTLNADDLTRAQAKIGLKGLPNFQFEHEGWRVDFYPIPKQEKYRNTEVTRPIGVTGQASASILETWKSIRDSVKDKANKYGAFGYPLVVVVNSMGVHTGKIDVMQALFGQESFTFSPTASETEMHRLGNGVWFGPKGIRYRRLSAVLVLSSLVPWGIGEAGCRLYHNPWTNYPYDGGLCRLPQARPEEDKMKNFSGASLLDLLGLPKGWPAH